MVSDLALAVIPLNCGQLQFNRSVFTGDTRSTLLVLPVLAFLILHPQGMILFDTGLPPQLWAGSPIMELTPGLRAKQGDSEGLVREIEKQGYSYKDIALIVNSHHHPDHAGGNALIPGAICIKGIQEDIKGDHDLLEDGSILLLPTPGHAGDHQSMLVKGNNKQVLLTGDACFRPHNLYDCNPPLILEDRKEALRSLKRLKEISEERETVILTSHDPSVKREKVIL
ncbi:N-acyl homoserine lactonase family protein [Desulfitobacterium chlororespirans]|nr:N-acyl homoserine lactonase family protein [Desulfitobacterium chlororespirans]